MIITRKDFGKLYLTPIGKATLIKELLHIIDEFKKEYREVFFLRNLITNEYESAIKKRIGELRKVSGPVSYEALNEDVFLKTLSKMNKDKTKVFACLNEVAKKYLINDSNVLLKQFKIILDLKDFIMGRTWDRILRTHEIGGPNLKFIAKKVFSDSSGIDWYKRRFYQTKYLKEDILSIADEVIKGYITEESFMNLVNPQLQDLIHQYRKEQALEIGYSLFNRVFIDINFTRWLYELPQSRLNQILMNHKSGMPIGELLSLCSQINKHLEILKFVVYSLIKTPISSSEISRISGKGKNFIKKYEKLIYEKKVCTDSLELCIII